MSEKHASLPFSTTQTSTPKPPLTKRVILSLLVAFTLYLTTSTSISSSILSSITNVLSPSSIELDFEALSKKGAVCPIQPAPLFPKMKLDLPEGYREKSAQFLSEAVQIPTQSYDDNGLPLEDPRWAPFFDFQKWLVKSFPTLHNHPAVTVEYVNTLGILLTIQGTNSTLKPLVLMSHYDVVPVLKETEDLWTHPPFSGFNDGEFIWGRGAADDKSLLVATYEALTLLLESNFSPKRTIILSHGFDEEEVGKRQGAGTLAPFLEERYGKDSPMLLIIDEGTGVIDDAWGVGMAVPASREKGYLDVEVVVGTPGGHSSVPPEHTGIGIMSKIVKAIEDNPFVPSLSTESPLLGHLTCGAKYAPNFPKPMKKLLSDPKKWDKLAGDYAELSRMNWALVTTTQAIDIIDGGVKVNALPEKVSMMMNFRINFGSSVSETQAHLSKTISKVTTANNFTFSSFGSLKPEEMGEKYVSANLFALPIEPSPDTPESGELWDMFAGTIKAASPGPNNTERIISPYSSTGNTDTKVYWNLSPNIYRFMSANMASGGGVHTVNERTSIDGHLEIVNWIWSIVQNSDDYDGPE